MKTIIVFFFAIGVFFLLLADSYGCEYHPYLPESTNTVINNTKGISAGISAAQCHPNLGQVRLQGCIGYGQFNGSNALTFGLAQKFKQTLISGTATVENNSIGIGIGGNWNF